MIDVTVKETGDSATAEDIPSALRCARVIGEEARKHKGIWGYEPTIVFETDDSVWAIKLDALPR